MRAGAAVIAFAPGRVNLIGEHTDYNGGLALPFAIEQGLTVTAEPLEGESSEIVALARDLGEQDCFTLSEPPPTDGWRAFVRGVAFELAAAGVPVRATRLAITGDVPRGAGLSSSAALSVSLALALIAVAGDVGALAPSGGPASPASFASPGVAGGGPASPAPFASPGVAGRVDPLALARLCSRVENEWVGARTGLLDPLAALLGSVDHGVRIDFATLATEQVPLVIGDWALVTVDSGESHSLAEGGYNERRAECEHACERLGIECLSEADPAALSTLPGTLARRTRHVLSENARVDEAVAALRAGDLAKLGAVLDASHASLRDLYDASTPAVERTAANLHAAGAAGARMVGGGFGGHVLALFPPGIAPPPNATVVTPSAGARVVGPAAS
ncbi:MAG TPA: galactokinase family protein [Conexibacter sp.]